ncbi:hypothetical protein BZA77DRAFT_366953 [Pyronema omphalodes]|nr:hypothetical protein BZA77DRAFT_366953 [Pyronema omphalodes]
MANPYPRPGPPRRPVVMPIRPSRAVEDRPSIDSVLQSATSTKLRSVPIQVNKMGLVNSKISSDASRHLNNVNDRRTPDAESDLELAITQTAQSEISRAYTTGTSSTMRPQSQPALNSDHVEDTPKVSKDSFNPKDPKLDHKSAQLEPPTSPFAKLSDRLGHSITIPDGPPPDLHEHPALRPKDGRKSLALELLSPVVPERSISGRSALRKPPPPPLDIARAQKLARKQFAEIRAAKELLNSPVAYKKIPSEQEYYLEPSAITTNPEETKSGNKANQKPNHKAKKSGKIPEHIIDEVIRRETGKEPEPKKNASDFCIRVQTDHGEEVWVPQPAVYHTRPGITKNPYKVSPPPATVAIHKGVYTYAKPTRLRNLGEEPGLIDCPECRHRTWTKIELEWGFGSIMSAVCWVLVFPIVFWKAAEMRDRIHCCSNCGVRLCKLDSYSGNWYLLYQPYLDAEDPLFVSIVTCII